MDKIEIPLSKKKIGLLLLGSCAFVVFGILFIVSPDTFVSPFLRNPQIIRFSGILSVLFFGTAGFGLFKKLSGNPIGLTIDENGIYDSTNMSSVGLIKWTDITEIRTGQVSSTKFLLIYVVNPDHYLNKVKGLKRKLMEGNHKMYGTPLSITSNTLKYRFEDLEKLVNDRLGSTKRLK